MLYYNRNRPLTASCTDAKTDLFPVQASTWRIFEVKCSKRSRGRYEPTCTRRITGSSEATTGCASIFATPACR